MNINKPILVSIFTHDFEEHKQQNEDVSESKFNNISLLKYLFSIVMFLVDYASDIWVIGNILI